ncbi:MAG: hypothetical protein Q9191_003579 [Dirinaria sp. TL-2023a]
MANVGLPWERDPRYAEACRTQVLPGGWTHYRDPRRAGVDGGDVTGFQAGQWDWSATNLPDILYQLFPDQAWLDFKANKGRARQKRDAQGRLMWEQWPDDPANPRPLLDFPVLANIDQISTQEHPLLMEAWRRLDPRITWNDLIMRMQRHGRSNANNYNMHCFRTWRRLYNITTWFWRGDLRQSPENVRVQNLLTPLQRQNNTTRGTTPGLINPAQGQGSQIVPFPNIGQDEGFPRRPPIPDGFQGLTRTIRWQPGHVGPGQIPHGSSATASTPRSGSRSVGQSTTPGNHGANDEPDEEDMDEGENPEDTPYFERGYEYNEEDAHWDFEEDDDAGDRATSSNPNNRYMF